MTSEDIRKSFLDFFKSKGHTMVASSSLLPENDPTTLFTGSGMQPMMPYLLGKPHPQGKRIVDIQRSFRAEDIEEVGDNRHTTFFEMLGNWSFGDYWKDEQLRWMFEFLIKELKIDPSRLYVTVFAGDEKNNIPRDTESPAIWKKLFSERGVDSKEVDLITLDNASKKGMQGGRIFFYGSQKNWWSRVGKPSQMPAGEPGGPDSEMFYQFDIPHDIAYGKECHPNCDCGRFIEIGNNVFMEYKKLSDGSFELLKQKNVDFGGGFERMVAAVQNVPDVFLTDLFEPLRNLLTAKMDYRTSRIIMDHSRAIAFLISDGLRPSNKDQGYVLRRLIRRTMAHFHQASFGSFTGGDILGQDFVDIQNLLTAVVNQYKEVYPHLDKDLVLRVFDEENIKYRQALNRGVRELKKIGTEIDAVIAFRLFESFGLTFEIIKDFCGDKATNLNREDFDAEFKKHQAISRAGVEKKFGGHGLILDTGELKASNQDELDKVLRLHTATHLLQAAMRQVLGSEVQQKGSDITAERTRFDYSFSRKPTPEEIKKVEDLINEVIQKDLPVGFVEMPKDEAAKTGALFFFKEKYPAKVKVCYVGHSLDDAFSKEFCGGPHVTHTLTIGHFKITKDESIGAGIRRIRGVVDK